MSAEKLWICEKPKQAVQVASRIGVVKKNDGYIETKNGLVTWCVGHLVGFKTPGEYDEKWKSWGVESLPIVPNKFDLEPLKGKEKQVKIVGKLLDKTNHVVIATDGDREGELLGREILDYFKWNGQIERMWNTNLDNDSVDKALKNIRPGDQYESLYHAASARAEADYINGMSLTRAATKSFSQNDMVLSVGRVQTAVLGMIVRRGQEIKQFKSRDFFELVSFHSKDDIDFKLRYSPKADDRIFDKDKADKLLTEIINKTVALSVEHKRKKTEPPQLFDLLALQQAANKAFKWSASETKSIAQELYDDSYISYPRTDSKFLPNEQEKDAEAILSHLSKITELNSPITSINELTFRKSVFDTSKTTAHHAIVPTKKAADLTTLSAKQRSLYKLVCTRYVAVFMPAYEYDSTVIQYEINDCVFKGVGNTPVIAGWKTLYQSETAENEENKDNQVFPDIKDGEQVQLENVFIQELKTKPPARFTQSSLLTAMKDISSLIEDDELKVKFKKRLKDKENAGIGTPATRDTYLDILINRQYVTLDKNKIIETDTGIKLVEALPDKVSDPIETAIMESYLDDIVTGQYDKNSFVKTTIDETSKYIEQISKNDIQIGDSEPVYDCSVCGKPMKRRKGAHGFFWSCSGYPGCNHAMNDSRGKPVEKRQVVISETPCPDCGKQMALRKPKKRGSDPFWGCTGYPDCKTTLPDNDGKPGERKVNDANGEKCPTCMKGNLVKRTIKKGNNKGKKFWGCSVYECKHFDMIES